MPRRADFEDDEEYEQALRQWQQQLQQYMDGMTQLMQTILINYQNDLLAELMEAYPVLKDKEMLLTQRVWTLKQQNPNLSPRALLHQAAKELVAELNANNPPQEPKTTATPSGNSAPPPTVSETPEQASGGVHLAQSEAEWRQAMQDVDDEYVQWRNEWTRKRALAPAIPNQRR